jgi:hypothetical protein
VLARCANLLVDYESMRRRARPDPDTGEQRGGVERGYWYYFNLATFIRHWAQGAYEGFEGEDLFALDAVAVTTVYQAKGREWQCVFVPSLSEGQYARFPSGKAGAPYPDWHIPEHCFDRSRYEGSVDDERRAFYVAITRPRNWLCLSSHECVRSPRKPTPPSRFLTEVLGGPPRERSPQLPGPPRRNGRAGRGDRPPFLRSFALRDVPVCVQAP